MSKMLSLLLIAGLIPVANAHTLAADDSLAMQLLHQLFGLHHLPATALVIVAVLVLLRVHYNRN